MADPKAGSRAALGSRCRELMQSEVYKEALGAVNDEYERAILKSQPHDKARRDELFMEYYALKRVVSRLLNWEADGAMAVKEITAEEASQ